jgi:hypothetical protein
VAPPDDWELQLDQWRSGELMNLLKLSALLWIGVTAVARAESVSEANLAIKVDLAKAQTALAQHNISAVFEATDDAMKYLPNADPENLQALIAFQNQFRKTLTDTTTAPPTSPKSAAPTSDQSAAMTQSSPAFPAEPVPAPAPPESPPTSILSANASPLPSALPPRKPKSQPKVASPLAGPPRAPVPGRNVWSRRLVHSAEQPSSRLALGARPWPYENHSEIAGTATALRLGSIPEPLFRTGPKASASQPDAPDVVRPQPELKMRANDSSNRKFLGYYAQDEDGKWVWLPVGSKDCPPAPLGGHTSSAAMTVGSPSRQ